MEARLNKSIGPYSAGTRVLVVELVEGYAGVELANPPYTEFDVLEEDVTECRPTREMVPAQNRHKRRAKKRAEFELLKELSEK